MTRVEEQRVIATTRAERVRGMLLIGATWRNAGKTALAEALIRRAAGRTSVAGIKVTTVHEDEGPCPRGSRGCGVCGTLDGPFRIIEELGENEGKDTARMLRAGASPVLWLCARPHALSRGLTEVRRVLPAGSLMVVESNSLRHVADPDLFIVVRGARSRKVKPSCREVLHLADEVVRFDGQSFAPHIDSFEATDGRWSLRRAVTAVVLAGGRSTRMGRDKALLPFEGRRMIEHIIGRIEPHVREVLVSATDSGTYAFLGREVVVDSVAGQGPMRAVATALERASHDVVLVVPCDVPGVPVDLLARLLRAARSGAEIVVPVTPDGQYEPLFAVYRRSVRNRLIDALERGERRIVSVYSSCDTMEVPMGSGDRLFNVNTSADYERALAER
jgi:molybdenum cofactor guanylyltransferase